ncbi:MAG: type II secretion system F family protein [Candidatus Gracilibacteria bacterium]|nr:type II secretion system F family protein [Candidatus Gracilibacteria bacterium]
MKIDFKNIFKNNQILKKKKNNVVVSQGEKIKFLDELYSLIISGIPITNALGIIGYQTKNKKVSFLVEYILKNLNKGKKIQESFEFFPKIFSQFDVNIIKMGEVTGKLGDSLGIIIDKEEKNKDLKTKLIQALIYPVIVVSLSIAMIFGFMIFVIPKVQKMYVDARVNLPDLTQNVINISEFISGNIILIVFGIIFIILGIQSLKLNKKTKYYYDKTVLEIPLFGGLIRKKILVVFTNTLGTLLKNGIMINQALEIAQKSLENEYYEQRVIQITKELNEGISLSELFGINKIKTGKFDKYFPIELASIVKIGEQTGKLPDLLLKISKKYNKEIDNLVKNLSTIIEPLVIVMVGGIVGTMVMAILLPFFNMVNVV